MGIDIAAHGSGELVVAGCVVELVGTPTIHAAHGSAGKALGSAALRLGLLFGGITFAFVHNYDTVGNVGLGVSIAAAAAIDATLLAWEPARLEDEQRPASWRSVTPNVALVHGGVSFGIAGPF